MLKSIAKGYDVLDEIYTLPIVKQSLEL